jgi:excisionase family DNA binding protein
MHKNDDFDPLMMVMTAQEAANLWRLSRNTVSDACRRGALRGRRSGQTWLLTVADMLAYQRGRYWPDLIPPELKPALDQARALMRNAD